MNNNNNNNSQIYLYSNYCLKKYKLNKYNLTNQQEVISKFIHDASSMILEFVTTHILELIHYDLYEPCFDDCYNNLYTNYIENSCISNILNIHKNEAIDILYKSVLIARALVFKFYIPKRSYKKTFIRKNSKNEPINATVKFDSLLTQITKLKNVIQPEQRTDEWYIFRNSTLTASNIWKIFLSECSQSQLILEKCQPVNLNKFRTTNVNSPMHWGQKYEPVSVLYYEYIYNTKVTDFGCIPHADYKFIAASPDGIICDTTSPLFGRMLEIKNVVSREINGKPKMEYWVQMQLQMEVCNLDECDFLETKFVEYTDEDEYMEDANDTNNKNFRGTFLYFVKDNEPYYIYPDFKLHDIHSAEYNIWFTNQINNHKDMNFVKIVYWKLQVISCILVLRNKKWFDIVLPYIDIFWTNLEKERDSGSYKERIKKKQKLAYDDAKGKSDFPVEGCLIDINSITTQFNINIHTNTVIDEVSTTDTDLTTDIEPNNNFILNLQTEKL